MLQPFKYITVVMKDRTNEGMQEEATGKPNMKPLIMLKNDKRYHPVTFGDDGLGTPFTDTNRTTNKIIGILLESFNKTNAQHKVMVHGICPMPAKSDVRAGRYVYWDTATNQLTITKTDNTPFIGRSMTNATNDGDMVDVLIS